VESLTAPSTSRAAQNDSEILSAFRLFAIARENLDDDEEDAGQDEEDDGDGEGVIKIADVRRCLTYISPRITSHPRHEAAQWKEIRG